MEVLLLVQGVRYPETYLSSGKSLHVSEEIAVPKAERLLRLRAVTTGARQGSLLIRRIVFTDPRKGVSSFLQCCVYFSCVSRLFSDWCLVADYAFRQVQIRSSALGHVGIPHLVVGARHYRMSDIERRTRCVGVRDERCTAKTPFPQHLPNQACTRERAQSPLPDLVRDVEIEQTAQRNRNLVNLIDGRSLRVAGDEVGDVDEALAHADRQMSGFG